MADYPLRQNPISFHSSFVQNSFYHHHHHFPQTKAAPNYLVKLTLSFKLPYRPFQNKDLFTFVQNTIKYELLNSSNSFNSRQIPCDTTSYEPHHPSGYFSKADVTDVYASVLLEKNVRECTLEYERTCYNRNK